MKKSLASISIALVCVMVVMAIGGISQVYAESRKIPIYCVDRDDNYVAISFDAAWGADKTRAIMDICEQYNVKATFFLVGFWIDKFPDMVAEISARGFEIGTHSETHPQMSKLTEQQVRNELTSSCRKLVDITGKPVKVFRPPFGDYNNRLLDVATELGLYTIQWSVDSLDWKGLSAVQIAERVQKAQSGDIILCHNNSDHIVEALPLIFEALQLKNLKFCTVSELIYFDNYYIDSNGKQISNSNSNNVYQPEIKRTRCLAAYLLRNAAKRPLVRTASTPCASFHCLACISAAKHCYALMREGFSFKARQRS